MQKSKIFKLMEVFDYYPIMKNESPIQDIHWRPKTKICKEAFKKLIAIENREALKAWYRDSENLNDRAEIFRRILEIEIEERLPTKDSKN